MLFSQDEHILMRKFADRWMMRVFGRGLNDRELHVWERKQSLLPVTLSFRPLARLGSRVRSIGTSRRRG